MYVRVRLEQAEANARITLPQQAVTRGATGDTVMVVGADGKVAPRRSSSAPRKTASGWCSTA
jgi:membrane fusion protein (multidrug efflux system)